MNTVFALFAAFVPLFEVSTPSEFDPEKAGWKCVFEDEFEGTELNTNKWYRPHFARKGQRIEPDGEGHLVFHVEKNEKGVIPNSYIYSTAEHECGYFEARVKFTKGLGWWAASWVYGGSNSNPFMDGLEIDTFEDFYTRLVDGHFLRDRIAHSLHVHTGDYCASQQIHCDVPPTDDDWHRIACKWDPFSFAFYLDGKLTGSYSAFNNAACIHPLHAVLSAEHSHGTNWLGGKGKPGLEEGRYEIDYVKIWKDPDEAKAPIVSWKNVDAAKVFVPTGHVERLAVEAITRDANDPVDQYYLFDNGYLVNYDNEAPASFKVTLTTEAYAGLNYAKFRGHRLAMSQRIDDGYPHVFVAYARTKSGRVGRTEPIYRLPIGAPASSAYEGKRAEIPGKIAAWRFDAGGQGKSYYRVNTEGRVRYSQKREQSPRQEEIVDCSKSQIGVTYAGEWVNYSVTVAEEGLYDAVFRYGTPIHSGNEALLLCDGELVGRFAIPADDLFTWSPTQRSTARVALPKGDHILTVMFKCQMMFGGLEFAAVAEQALVKGETEILVDAQAKPATKLAAAELQDCLWKIFGEPVAIVTAPTPGRRHVRLVSRKMTRDAFTIKAEEGGVVITGSDSDFEDPEAHNYLGAECMWQPQFERGTYFGVIDFLERFAGARFYFPGELGTILPRAEKLVVTGADVESKPDFTVRRWGYADGPVPEEVLAGMDITDFKRKFFYRLRGETEYKPCCHGQNKLFLSQRFGEKHPEYMRLDEKGNRSKPAPKWSDRPDINVGHLCLSSDVWNEIYEDVKSYFRGESAEVRGVHAPDGQTGYAWGRNASEGRFMDLMPQDCYSRCYCEKCKAAYGDRKDEHYATELIWSKTAELGRKLKADGLDGRIAMMSYHPYGRVPDFELPDNIDVMVAVRGPWSYRSRKLHGAQKQRIAEWSDKLGHKVWTWNYVDKVQCVGTAVPDAPSVSPRVMGRFYKDVSPFIFGAFAESESDRWLYHYLNYYVFSKVAWDNSADVDAILAEHHRLMFGKGGEAMRKFFELLEDCWVDGIAGNAKDTPLGPKTACPGALELWTAVYSPETMQKLDALLSAAEGKVAADSLEARRIALFRRHYYEPLSKWPAKFAADTSVEAEQARRKARTPDSILRNGDFSTLDGWVGEHTEWGTVSLSTNEFVSPPSSLMMESHRLPRKSGEWQRYFATQYPKDMIRQLRPNTKYRVSFYAKCDHLSSFSTGGGLYVQWWDSNWNWVPRKGFPVSGDAPGWYHFEYEFKTPETFDERKEHFVQFMVTSALGRVYVDDILLEPLGSD